MSAATNGTSSITVSIVPKLSRGTSNSGGNTDTVSQVVSSITGIAESVGKTRETVSRATLTNSVIRVSVSGSRTVTDTNSVTQVIRVRAAGLDTDGYATSDSVVLVSLKASSEADRLIVVCTGGADTCAAIGSLGKVLPKLAVGSDLTDSSNSIKGISVHTAGAGSTGSRARSTVTSTLSALSSNGTVATGA